MEQMTPDVAEALAVIQRGGLVAIPTETVYGLAADASNPTAVRRIFDVKGRPYGHPVIVHVADLAAAQPWVSAMSAEALALAEACWPGPLTLLLPRSARAHDGITGGRETVGIRVPAHQLTNELLAAFGGGLAAPSANRFGRVSPTTAQHVRADLGPDVDFVLDGGPCAVGVESTIVDCSGPRIEVVRAGAITTDDIAQVLDGPVYDGTGGASRAPGMLSSHYAPRCRILLADDRSQVDEIAGGQPGVRVLDYGDDIVLGARSLYADLRRADADRVSVIVAVMPPARGLGYALRDRLTKAAAPRPAS